MDGNWHQPGRCSRSPLHQVQEFDVADRDLEARAARPINLADIIEAMADAVPDRVAVATMDRDYTYAETDERSTRLAWTRMKSASTAHGIAIRSCSSSARSTATKSR